MVDMVKTVVRGVKNYSNSMDGSEDYLRSRKDEKNHKTINQGKCEIINKIKSVRMTRY